ncbi:MAG: hypothetical protein ACO3A4_11080 [Silvanigrellaceae bacterium]
MKGIRLLMASAALLAGTKFAHAADKAHTEIRNCTLKYSSKQTVLPSKQLDDCLSVFANRKADVEHVQIIASTRLAGTHKTNLWRANARLENLRGKLTSEFPNVRIESVNAGPSRELGDTLRMTIISLTPEVKAAMADASGSVTTEDRRLHTTAGAGSETGEPQIEPQKEGGELPRVSVEPVIKSESMRENFGRIAARMGQDSDRDLDESFPVIGLEVAYVRPNTGMPNLRTEAGATLASMSKGDKLMKQASAHALLGAGFNINGVILGARALGGGVWDEENKWRDDFGGEGRLGFENKTLSVFAGVGRTQKTSRFGLDVGILL